MLDNNINLIYLYQPNVLHDKYKWDIKLNQVI